MCPQKKHEQLLMEQGELAKSRDDRRELTQEFMLRTEKLTQGLKEDQQTYKEQLENEKVQIFIWSRPPLDVIQIFNKVI